MSNILSICIPTYMREKNIDNLLKSITPICKELSIEICVSDNHSYDNTEKIVEKKKEEYENIIYHKQTINTLTDNFYHAISLSNSNYVWLLGDNDLPPVDLIREVYEECRKQKYASIILHEKTELGNGKRIQDVYIDLQQNRTFRANEYNEILKELGCSMHLISNVVIEKKAWDISKEEYTLLKKYFPNSEHVGVIFKHLRNTNKESLFIYDKYIDVTPVYNSIFPENIEPENNYEKIYGNIRHVTSWYDMFSNFERAFLNLQAFGYDYECIKIALKKREDIDIKLTHSYSLFSLIHLKGSSKKDYYIIINDLHFAKKTFINKISIMISRLFPSNFCVFLYRVYTTVVK